MARSTILRAKNLTGSTLAAGTVVYISGYDEDDATPLVAPASCDDESRMPAVGVVREDIENGNTDVVKISGAVNAFDTSIASTGSNVYVGQNGGVIFDTEPATINQNWMTQQIGSVTKVSGSPNGLIQLYPLEIKRRIKHPELIEVYDDQHHNKLHAYTHSPGGIDQFIHARQHAAGGGDEISHGLLAGIGNDDHTQYSRVDGTRDYTGIVSYSSAFTFSDPEELVSKRYVDSAIPGQVWRNPVEDKDLDAAPLGLGAGDSGRRWIVDSPTNPIDEWYSHDDHIAEWDGSVWSFNVPVAGWTAWVDDESSIYSYDGYNWAKVSGTGLSGSGTATQLAFWDSPTSISSSSNLYWDSVNNRLGINTSSPVARLEVEDGGSAANLILKITADDENPYGLVIGNDSFSTTDTNGLTFYVTNGGIGHIRTIGTNGQLHLGGSSAQSIIQINSSGLVGIGSVPSVEQLTIGGAIVLDDASAHTVGAIRWTGTDFEGNVDGTALGWTSLTASGGSTSPGGSDGQVQYNNGGSFGGAAIYYSDGSPNRFGIGASSSSYGLYISTMSTSNTASVRINASLNNSGKGLTINAATRDTSGDATDELFEVVAGSSLGTVFKTTVAGDTTINSLILGGAAPSSNGSVRWNGSNFQGYKSGGWVNLDEAGGSTSPGGSTGNIQYNSAGSFAGEADLFWDSANDRLGIGTNSPDTSLHVLGDIYVTGGIINDALKTALDGYGTGGGDTSELEQQVTWIQEDLDGYAIGTNVVALETAMGFVLPVLDGYSGDANVEALEKQVTWIQEDLDGYALQSNVDILSDQVTIIQNALDGYSTTTIPSGILDGYADQQLVSDHDTAIGHILNSLDGYSGDGGSGNVSGSGSDGYVTYWTGDGYVSGSDNLYFNYTDGYLGVGTSEPNERVTVDGAISFAEVAEPEQEIGYGKLYVNVTDGRIYLKMSDGQNVDLTAFDIDGGSFDDTYESTRDFDAGTF